MNPPSSPFSPTRPSRLILHQSSLSEAQTNLRLSSRRLRLYASETDNNTQKNDRNETDYLRASSDTGNTPRKAPDSAKNKCLSHDSSERPNSPNTPSPVSSRANRFWSDLDLWQDREDNVASEKASNLKPNWLKQDGGPSYDSYSLNSVPEVWKPPKPRKPTFLTASGSTVFDAAPNPSENAQYLPTLTIKGKDQKDLRLPRGYIWSSSPSNLHKVPKIRLNVNRATRKEADTTQNVKPRGQARKVIWRPSLRPAPYRAPVETCQLPVHDPERPFPMPIPTMDKLPLCLENLEYQSLDGQEKDKGGESLLLRFKRKAFEFSLVIFSLDVIEHPAQLSGPDSHLLRVGIRWSITPLNSASTQHCERETAPEVPADDTVNLLRLRLAVPVLLLHAASVITATTQRLRYPKVLTTIVRFVTALVFLLAIITLWVSDKLRSNTTPGSNKIEAKSENAMTVPCAVDHGQIVLPSFLSGREV